MLISRALLPTVIEKFNFSNKGIVVYGARQVGKTTLMNEIIHRLNVKTLMINGDHSRYLDILSSRDLSKIKSLVEGYELLFVDEAQRIPEIGIALKIILDNIPYIRVLVTGSSSLDLVSKISEPLTGRVWSYRLYPISFLELLKSKNRMELDSTLEERLVYGSYPEIFSITGGKQKWEYLQNLNDGYLYKDLVEFGDIKNSGKIRDLLKLLAFQIGSQVSLTEIGNSLDMSKDTVARYIDLLEKSYIIFRLKGFSRNLRKEVTKMDKIYFYDLGVRNILIDNLKPLKDRADSGQLWENFLITERMKLLDYTKDYALINFWRTYTGAELDYVEEKDGKLTGYEFKFGNKVKKVPSGFLSTYPGSDFHCINRDNYLDFILGKVDAND